MSTVLSRIRKLDETELERRIIDVSSVASALFLFATLVYLHTLAVDFGETPRIFPLIIVRAGIVIAALLVFKEVITRFVKPGLFEADDDEVIKHLTGEKSQFPIPVRVKRLLVIGLLLVAFFGIATVNVLLSIAICYPATLYLLGLTDIRRITVGSVVLLAFVYLVFVLFIQMPLDLF